MEKIICDMCNNKSANRKFKVKMSRRGHYLDSNWGFRWVDIWHPYEKIDICEDCFSKLFINKR